MNDTKIGDRIKILRNNYSMKQQELADLIGVGKSTLGMYETNKREPNLLTIIKLCKALNTDGNYLVGTPSKLPEHHILTSYNKLNDAGKQKATEYIQDLSEQEKYTKSIPHDEEQKYEGMRLAAFGGDMKGTPKKKKPRLSPQQ